jgi:hypothetical protein
MSMRQASRVSFPSGRALKWLKEQAALNPADASLTSGNQRYAIGDHVKIELQARNIRISPCSICR